MTELERAPGTPSGLDIAGLDPSIRAQDDLFRHVNGRWLDSVEIPADKSTYGSFSILNDEAEAAVREILEQTAEAPAGSGARKAADAYASFMDVDRLTALGTAPIADDLARALAAGSIEQLLAELGRQERQGVAGFIGMYVIGDVGEPTTNALYFEQSGLGLPDESYYREEQYAPLREAYLAHVERMLTLVGLADAGERAARVVELETAVAGFHWDNVRTREADQTYNPTTLEEFLARFPGVPVRAWLDTIGAPEGIFERFVLNEPSFADGLATLLVDDRLAQWQDWLAWRIVQGFATLLTPEISQANFEFYGTTLQGTPTQRDRWKRGVGFAESVVGEEIGREYVARHFRPSAKEQMDALVRDLLDAYRASIGTLDWMSPPTRERALAKLDRFRAKIGYPVKWRDYSALEIDATDLIGNARRAAEFDGDWEWSKVGHPVDLDLWLMSPQTVNAYYLPHQNEIVFPAAILQPPFFSEERDAAANYGAIGAVIGHEIGHGFDDQGSKYDGDGRLEDWWTPEDRAAFEQATAALIGQYSALVPAGQENHVNGELTIGENIGDLGGLGIAWKAYQRHLDGAEAPVIDGLSGAERFFLSWAQAWRTKRRPEMVQLLLQIDPHSPDEFRCNQIVRNLDVFAETFGLQPGDGLWLEPSERVTIW